MNIELKQPTARGPAETFTGHVWVDPIATRKPEPSRMVVSRVRFAPGARTAWHSHAVGQTLHVTDGVALMQARGGEVIEVHPGQSVYTPQGKSTGTVRPRTTSWSTSPCWRVSPKALRPRGSNTSPTRSTAALDAEKATTRSTLVLTPPGGLVGGHRTVVQERQREAGVVHALACWDAKAASTGVRAAPP